MSAADAARLSLRQQADALSGLMVLVDNLSDALVLAEGLMSGDLEDARTSMAGAASDSGSETADGLVASLSDVIEQVKTQRNVISESQKKIGEAIRLLAQTHEETEQLAGRLSA